MTSNQKEINYSKILTVFQINKTELQNIKKPKFEKHCTQKCRLSDMKIKFEVLALIFRFPKKHP